MTAERIERIVIDIIRERRGIHVAPYGIVLVFLSHRLDDVKAKKKLILTESLPIMLKRAVSVRSVEVGMLSRRAILPAGQSPYDCDKTYVYPGLDGENTFENSLAGTLPGDHTGILFHAKARRQICFELKYIIDVEYDVVSSDIIARTVVLSQISLFKML